MRSALHAEWTKQRTIASTRWLLSSSIGLIIALGALVALAEHYPSAGSGRESAAAIATVLGLLYLFPILAHLVSDPNVQRRLEQIAPMTAGLAIQSTTNLHKLPIAPWAGLAVLAAWATTAVLAGGLLLSRRDA
jgi:ABC-2 type transport system permease protein